MDHLQPFRGLISALAVLTGGALMLSTFQARYADTGLGAAYGTMYYPRLVLGAWILLAVLSLVSDWTAPGAQPESRRWGGVLLLLACEIFALGIMKTIGFVPAASLVFVATVLIMGYRNAWVWVPCAALFPLGLAFVFDRLLGVVLPGPSLTGLF